jgi:glycosyltransferase involved in cell wall biosynthesis
MLNIIERLDRSLFEPAVCVIDKGGLLDREVEAIGIPFLEAPFTIPAKPYHSLLMRARKAARPFQPYKFQLWHSFHYRGEYTEPIIARLAGARWIYTKKNMNWGRSSWHIRTLLASRVAAQNQDMMKDFFDQPLYRHKARLVPRGVVVEKFRPEVQATLNLRKKYNIPPEMRIVGCVAQLLPVKGHATLIKAIANLPNIFLFLAGKPLEEEYFLSLQQLVHELEIEDRVKFLDFVEDIPAFLAEIDLFILPTLARSRMEGCPVALLEAMSSGKACLASNIPGSRDLIVHDHCGFLFPPGDDKALADGISYLLNDDLLRNKLAAAARERVLHHYTIEQEVTLHQSLYTELMDRV